MQIKALILDMDGVLWRANEPIVDLATTFNLIRNKGLRYAFATNNSSRTINDYVEKINGFGVPVVPDQIFTSATATATYLSQRFPAGGNLFIIGASGLKETLQDKGFTHSLENPLAIVAGIDRNIDYMQIAEAGLLARSGVPFIGTNSDRSFPSPRGLMPGAGAIQAAIEAASDVQPFIIGKPKTTMFEQAIKYLGTRPAETLMIGDRLETDILGGQAVGCKTALMLSGVSTAEAGKTWKPQIDFITENLDTLVKQL